MGHEWETETACEGERVEQDGRMSKVRKWNGISGNAESKGQDQTDVNL